MAIDPSMFDGVAPGSAPAPGAAVPVAPADDSGSIFDGDPKLSAPSTTWRSVAPRNLQPSEPGYTGPGTMVNLSPEDWAAFHAGSEPSLLSVAGLRKALAPPPGYVPSGILPLASKAGPDGQGDINAGVKWDWGPIRSIANPLLDLLEGTGLATSVGGPNAPLAGKVSPEASGLLFSVMAGNPNPFASTKSIVRPPFSGPEVVPSAAPNSMLDLVQPLVPDELRATLTAKQVKAAGGQLTAETTDLPAAHAAIDNAPGPLVPGDAPRTANVTGDPGIGSADYSAQRGVGPIPERVTRQQAAFADQASRQNDVRVRAIQDVAPEGNPLTADAALKQHAAEVDAAASGQYVQAERAANARVSEAEAAANARTAELQRAADETRAGMGGDLGDSAHEDLGKALREPLAKNNQAAWDDIGRKAAAVDPTGTLAAPAGPVRAAAEAINKERGPYADVLSPDEARILKLAEDVPEQLKFKDLKEFRTQVTNAISEARQNGRKTGVLSDILSGIHEAMDSAGADAGGSVAEARPAVRTAAEVGAPAVGGVGSRDGQDGDLNGGSGSGPTGQETSGRGGQSASVLDETAGLTPFDAAANERYAAYRQAVRERAATFENAPGVGQALKQGRWSGEFKTPDSALPRIFVKVDEAGRDNALAYLKAGGDPSALTETAAFSLRDYAMRRTGPLAGTLDPAKYDAWVKAREPFLSVVPDVKAKFGAAGEAQRAADTGIAGAKQTMKEAVAAAEQTIKDASASRAATIKQVQDSAVGKFLGDADPVARIWTILNDKALGASKARELKAAIAGNADAEAGLQRMIGEAIEKNLVGVPKGITSQEGQVAANGLQKFMKFSEPALSELLSSADLAKLKAVQEMMIRDYRTAQVGFGSPTGQLARAGVTRTLLGTILKDSSGGTIGAAIGAWMGGWVGMPSIGAGIGSKTGLAVSTVIQAASEAGIQNVADLKAAAHLNPALFRILTTEATPKNRMELLGALASTLRRASLVDRAPQVGRLAAPGAQQSYSDRRVDQQPVNALAY